MKFITKLLNLIFGLLYSLRNIFMGSSDDTIEEVGNQNEIDNQTIQQQHENYPYTSEVEGTNNIKTEVEMSTESLSTFEHEDFPSKDTNPFDNSSNPSMIQRTTDNSLESSSNDWEIVSGTNEIGESLLVEDKKILSEITTDSTATPLKSEDIEKVNEELVNDIKRLEEENTSLREENKRLNDEKEELREKVKNLEEEIQKAEAKLNKEKKKLENANDETKEFIEQINNLADRSIKEIIEENKYLLKQLNEFTELFKKRIGNHEILNEDGGSIDGISGPNAMSWKGGEGLELFNEVNV